MIATLSKTIATLVLAGWASTASAAVLFHEDWSNISNGGTAVSGGNWEQTNGTAAQITVIDNPGSYTGKFIRPAVYGDTGGLQLLPTILSTNAFAFAAEGLSLNVQVALGTGNNSANYFRIGLRSATNSQMNYWFDLYGTYARIQKQTGNAATVITLGEQFNYTAGYNPINNLTDISFTVIPLSEGGNRVSLWINGFEATSFDDTTGAIPNFSGGLDVFIGMRSPRLGYVGEITVESIPEPGTWALGLGAGATLLLSRRGVRRRLNLNHENA